MAGRSGIVKFTRKDQYNDFIDEIKDRKDLAGKSMGVQPGLMVLFSNISDEQQKEIVALASGGAWYDEGKLSLGGQ